MSLNVETRLRLYANALIATSDKRTELIALMDEAAKELADFRFSDKVKLTRCRDCKYADTYPEDGHNDMPLKCIGIRYGGVYPDWYCEHGQRREDGDNT